MDSKTTAGKKCPSQSAGETSKRPSENSEVEPPRKLRHASKRALEEDVSLTDGDGRSPLHHAAKEENLFKVKNLIARGADTRLKDREGLTPLHLALFYKKKKSAELLAKLDSGNDVVDIWRRTPLHWAASLGPLAVVKKLLAGGARTRVLDEDGMSPLHLGLIGGSQAAAELLAKADVFEDVPERSFLHWAIESRYAGVVAILLHNDINPHIMDDKAKYPIQLALRGRKNRHIPNMILSSIALKDILVNWGELQLSPDELRFCIDTLSRCSEQIRLMKNAQIQASSVTYHELVTRHVSVVAPRLQSKSSRDLMQRDSLLRDFPLYADRISVRLQLAEERKVLMDLFIQCVSRLPKLPSLPVLCSDILLRCLCDLDIKNFIHAMQFPPRK